VKSCPECSIRYGDEIANCPRDGTFLRFEPGAVIRKKYEILGIIGIGGMGIVYRARHLHFSEDRALKVFSGQGKDAQQGLRRLIAEAKVMRQLQHPHIVQVDDTDVTEHEQPFVVMEFVDGRGLNERLNDRNGLPVPFALRLAGQTCSALSATHNKGILHRDIKPQNLLLARQPDGQEAVKIIDFGIAKVRPDAGLGFTGVVSATAGFIGTWAYASPEQMEGKGLDGRSDLYSLGLVLYEMLSGKRPFPTENLTALVEHRLRGQPVPLEEARPDLRFSRGVSALVKKAIAREREHRFQTAEEMGRALAALEGEPHEPSVWVKREGTRAPREIVETKPLAKLNPKDGLEYVWVPPGEFLMGCSPGDSDCHSNEQPPRSVTIEKGFWLGQTPVTQEAYERVMDTNPSFFRGAHLPVDTVTLDDAREYAKAIGGRLPTEEEWEYAARGGMAPARYGRIDEIAWYGRNSAGKTQDIGRKMPNKYGLHDMLGNVWEWTEGALRGGAWYGSPETIRVSVRMLKEPAGRFGCTGFRCVWE
jgi:serine/threonine protein kinase